MVDVIDKVADLDGPHHPGMYVVLKRDLFYKPKDCGYTGIRDHAGVYTEAEARDKERPDYGVTIMRWEDAPEFTRACYDDLARLHLQQRRDAARTAARDIAAALADRTRELDAARARVAELEGALAPFAVVGANYSCAPHAHPRREANCVASPLWSYTHGDDVRREITVEHVREAARLLPARTHGGTDGRA